MAGYSGTPLPKKLGIKENFRVVLHAMPPDVSANLREALADCKVLKKPSAPLDFVMLFSKRRAELSQLLPVYSRLLAPEGIFWVSWPKRSSGVACDMNENDIRDIGLGIGLVDVKVCAVNDVWSGLKFMIPVKDRKRS
ncbi:MAG TPA: hypothetical protein VH088_11285 [Terriglobales bacterium]|jgi:hypothetical protein|nr:hypothetical protein [Terriglobales bacterium]